MKQISASDLVELPIQERIQLVEDVWDTIIAVPEEVKLPEWHKKELDERLESRGGNPKKGSSWSDVKRRILGDQ